MRGLAALAIASAALSCGEPADQRVAVHVSFRSGTAAAQARTLDLQIFELESDSTANPCRELLAGGDAAAIGLAEELSESTEISADAPALSIVFALYTTSGGKVIYSEATDRDDAVFARGCATASPATGDIVRLELRGS